MTDFFLEELKKKYQELMGKFKLEEKKAKIKSLEEKSMDPNFWLDQKKAVAAMREMADLQEEVQQAEEIEIELEVGPNKEELKKLESKINKLEIKVFLSGKYDRSSAILSIHAGQGGTEACDWAQMLYRMYFKYAQKKNWKVSILDEHPGEEAGVKSVILEIIGSYVYGYLKFEKGAHRLVRQSPFNADNLRQTSFALVEVMPIIEEQEELEIKPDDIQFESFRSSGHGGQNVNKVSTAVRLKHIPTGIIVECRSQRYQEQNRKIAMEILRSKIWLLKEQEREQTIKTIKGKFKIAGWGNQIRSYVLHPYKMVKDLRTDYEESNAEAVLSGNLENFIQTGLKNIELVS